MRKFTFFATASVLGTLLLCGCGGAAKGMSDMAMTQGTASDFIYKSQSNAGSYDGFANLTNSYRPESDSVELLLGGSEKPTMDSQSSKNTYGEETEKIIRTIRMSLQTKKFDELLGYLEGRVSEVGGYVQNSKIYGNEIDMGAFRSAELTYRIPQDRLDEFVEGVGQQANVVFKTENAENVTLQYADTESRLKALRIEQERFLELLTEAKDVDSVITIEKHLTELRYEIESYTSQLKVYDNRVSYSTVTLSISEVNRIVPVEKNPTVWTRMRNGFSETMHEIKEGSIDFLVWLVTNCVYLLIWGVVLAVVIIVAKRKLKLRRNKTGKLGTGAENGSPSGTEEEQNDRMDLTK